MKLFQNNVLGGDKLNYFKATQVLGSYTYIDMGVWNSWKSYQIN